MLPTCSPGDVVVFNGVTAVVWAKSTSTIRVMAVARARGPHHRADVPIGSHILATLSGPLLASTATTNDIPQDADVVVIGRLDNAQRQAIFAAMARESDARRAEQSVTASAIFSACQPSFRSGGRRVGVRAGV